MSHGQTAERHLLAHIQPRDRARLVVHPALGGHPGMAALVCRLAAHAAARHRCDRSATALLLAGHGNARHPAAGAAVRRLARRVRARTAAAAEVHCAFLEQAPLLEDWPALTGRSNVIVVPCFLAPGRHVREDLPARLRLGAAADGGPARRVFTTGPLAKAADDLAAMVRDLAAVGTPPLEAVG